MAPAAGFDDQRSAMQVYAKEGIILNRLASGGCRTSAKYGRVGGYRAIEKALTESPEEIIQRLEASGLRGRGGAGFPTGKKWRAVSRQAASEKFVVANADEGDPGAYIDRFIMEDDPYCLIEGLLIAGYAVEATRGYIYLRKEYPQAQAVLTEALSEARSEGWLGKHIAGSSFSFDIELVMGKGSYICGEETSLLNSIEGRRPEVWSAPLC